MRWRARPTLQYLVMGMAERSIKHRRLGPELRDSDVLDMSATHFPPRARRRRSALDRLYADICRGDTQWYVDAYRRDCVTLGKTVQLLSADGRREMAQALDIDDEFGLIVRLADGTVRTVRTGEVSVRGMYGYVD